MAAYEKYVHRHILVFDLEDLATAKNEIKDKRRISLHPFIQFLISQGVQNACVGACVDVLVVQYEDCVSVYWDYYDGFWMSDVGLDISVCAAVMFGISVVFCVFVVVRNCYGKARESKNCRVVFYVASAFYAVFVAIEIFVVAFYVLLQMMEREKSAEKELWVIAYVYYFGMDIAALMMLLFLKNYCNDDYSKVRPSSN